LGGGTRDRRDERKEKVGGEGIIAGAVWQVGYEGLRRWKRPERAVLQPTQIEGEGTLAGGKNGKNRILLFGKSR